MFLQFSQWMYPVTLTKLHHTTDPFDCCADFYDGCHLLYIKTTSKKKNRKKLSGKNDPQAMKSLEIEVFLIMYHINCNSPTDNEYYILLYKQI